ncbi:plasminogen activator inhibitor 1 RNA-binding protein isoform X2 [Copidosoma floridanum]|uniref:plasminogen activator inhibitor 1 RNA-binding protein isoform X2 n=1 Tax=Copidosoma floridanum TaxID=29053 RepID=UPI0006C958A0|nr:plasminogen activator inhibitor 1 RNA-binding protein isoform X2 [Copidosoma floridanum]
MEYNVSVSKRFLLDTLDEDADPLEILNRAEKEREARRKEKLIEKNKQEKESKTTPAAAQQPSNKKASRTNKENLQQQAQQQPPAQQQQQQPRNQDAKKDQGDKKPGQQKFGGGERNVKFASENREDHTNRRNREDGERPPRAQNDFKRGPPGEQREQRDYPYQGSREYRNSNISGTGGMDGDRRPRGPPREGGGRGGGERGGGGGERGGYRGGRGGGFRGGRGGGFDSRGKREYDRQSGSDKTYGYSGVKPIDKKDGAGSHNWGNHNDDIEDAMNQSDDWGTPTLAVVDATVDNSIVNENKENSGSPNVSGIEAPAGDGIAPVAEEKPAEEEARELTLDEWKALRQTNRVKPTYNLRKAGEGEDLSRWKKMYALERKKEGADDEDEEEEEYDAAEYPQRVGRQKHVLDIEINFNDSRRSGGGRGGRGGRGGNRMNGRGFGGRGGGPPREGRDNRDSGEGGFRNQEQRSPRERQNAPKVDDEHDFPSLG